MDVSLVFKNRLMKIETDRLLIRPFVEADFDPFANMVADPDVMKYIADGKALPRHKAFYYMKECIMLEKTLGYSRYAVLLKDSATFIGFCGYKPYLDNNDLGWRYAKEYWGKGYGTEAAMAVLKFGLEELKMEKIVCIAHPENIGSIRIMEKIGLVYKGKWELPSGVIVERYENGKKKTYGQATISRSAHLKLG